LCIHIILVTNNRSLFWYDWPCLSMEITIGSFRRITTDLTTLKRKTKIVISHLHMSSIFCRAYEVSANKIISEAHIRYIVIYVVHMKKRYQTLTVDTIC